MYHLIHNMNMLVIMLVKFKLKIGNLRYLCIFPKRKSRRAVSKVVSGPACAGGSPLICFALPVPLFTVRACNPQRNIESHIICVGSKQPFLRTKQDIQLPIYIIPYLHFLIKFFSIFFINFGYIFMCPRTLYLSPLSTILHTYLKRVPKKNLNSFQKV